MGFIIHCPHCHQSMTAKDSMLGKVVSCMRCNQHLRVGRPAVTLERAPRARAQKGKAQVARQGGHTTGWQLVWRLAVLPFSLLAVLLLAGLTRALYYGPGLYYAITALTVGWCCGAVSLFRSREKPSAWARFLRVCMVVLAGVGVLGGLAFGLIMLAAALDSALETKEADTRAASQPPGAQSGKRVDWAAKLRERDHQRWRQLGLLPFTSAEDGFSAWFPAKPEKGEYDIGLGMTNYAAMVEGEAAYNVFVNEFPAPVLTDKAVDASLKGYLEGKLLVFGKNAPLVRTQTITFLGRRALDYEYTVQADGRNVCFRGVAFHEGKWLYCISVVCPVPEAKTTAYTKYRAFRDSFRLTGRR